MSDVLALLHISLEQAAGGDADLALQTALRAVAEAPASAVAQAHLGSLLLARQQPVQAASHLARALEMNAALPQVWNNMGAAMRLLGKPNRALECFERALELDSSYRDALVNALELQQAHAQYEEVLSLVRRPGSPPPNNVELRMIEIRALVSLGRLAEAMKLLEETLAAEPASAEAHALLAEVCTTQGDFDRATSAMREAIRLNPHGGSYYRYLADIDATALGADEIAGMATLAHSSAADDSARAEALLARARLHETAGEWDAAYNDYNAANAVLRSFGSYDESETLEAFERIIEQFSAEFIANGALGFHDSEKPVFIFGMPRSGTTLVEQIIAAHPFVHAAGELTAFGDSVEREFSIPSPITADVAKRYIDMISEIAPPAAARVTDKMPFNFRYAGLIHMVFPKARMIHVHRDPLETVWSCYTTRLTDPALTWTCNLDEITRYYHAYQRLMNHWRDVLPTGCMLEVSYEDVVADIDTQARRIIAYCGLPWDDRCLRFYDARRAVHTASSAQVRKPIYTSSLRRARSFREHLRPVAQALEIEL